MGRIAEGVLRRHRAATIAALVILALLAWIYLLAGAGMGGAGGMDGMMAMPPPGLFALAAMWWVMMIAMMVPSAAPAVLLYARVNSQRVDSASSPTGAFLSGYLACWLAFSLAAAAAQLWLQQAEIASPMSMALHSRAAGGALLILAGLYQLSPLKHACLGRCRSPASFLTVHYRPGQAGAFRLGLLHGAFCVGCCWLLMLLLFVGGVMNFAWIAGLTLLVAAEKMLPNGDWLARIAGAAMIGWGIWIIVR